MDGFSAERWSKLTDAQRIEHCQMAAREIDTYAESAGPILLERYQRLAAQWRALAIALGQSISNG